MSKLKKEVYELTPKDNFVMTYQDGQIRVLLEGNKVVSPSKVNITASDARGKSCIAWDKENKAVKVGPVVEIELIYE